MFVTVVAVLCHPHFPRLRRGNRYQLIARWNADVSELRDRRTGRTCQMERGTSDLSAEAWQIDRYKCAPGQYVLQARI
jgi:hypothetical protein